MMTKETLFTPLNLPHITLPGRLIRSSTELFCSRPDGHIDPREIGIYRELSRQPLGMILTAHTCVSPEGRSNLNQNALFDESFLPDAQAIAETASANGVPAVMQIGHGGMKAEGSNGGLPVCTPDNMTVEQIRGVVKAVGRAAALAKKAGFAGVMLHGAHMYLFSQWFYPETNHRTDAYGGCAENRFRIIREAILEVKAVCGDDYPVFLKINGTDRNYTEAYYRDLETALAVGRESGLEAAEISGWNANPRGIPKEPYFLPVVRRLTQFTDLPIFEVGGFRSAEGMLLALEAGAKAVSLSRPLLCEPDFPSRLRDTENAEAACIYCDGCFHSMPEGADTMCVQVLARRKAAQKDEGGRHV